MIDSRSLPVIMIAALPYSGAQAATTAPAQLLNKTIIATWSRDISQKRADGTIINVNRTDTRQIFVSTAGRLFLRSSAQARRRYVTREFAPGDNTLPGGFALGAKFEGSRLLLTRTHYSGAGRLVIEFGPGFTTCTATLIVAREGSAPVKWRGLTGETLEPISQTLTSGSCKVMDGNLFAEQ